MIHFLKLKKFTDLNDLNIYSYCSDIKLRQSGFNSSRIGGSFGWHAPLGWNTPPLSSQTTNHPFATLAVLNDMQHPRIKLILWTILVLYKLLIYSVTQVENYADPGGYHQRFKIHEKHLHRLKHITNGCKGTSLCTKRRSTLVISISHFCVYLVKRGLRPSHKE